MREKQKHGRNSSANWLEKLFSPRVGKRVTAKQSGEFRKLSSKELERIGLSPKSERYVETSVKHISTKTPTLSKRQYQQKQLGEASGRRVTLEQRAREFLTGEREATSAQQAQLREKSLEAWRLRKKYKGERVARIREHLHNIELKERGDYLDKDIWLREKAFSEAHRDVPDESGFYQKWFNYGHVKRAA